MTPLEGGDGSQAHPLLLKCGVGQRLGKSVRKPQREKEHARLCTWLVYQFARADITTDQRQSPLNNRILSSSSGS